MYPVDPEKLLALREYKDVGQKVLADRLNLSLSTYASKESKGKFVEDEVEKICEVLKVKPLQILQNKIMSDILLQDMIHKVDEVRSNLSNLNELLEILVSEAELNIKSGSPLRATEGKRASSVQILRPGNKQRGKHP